MLEAELLWALGVFAGLIVVAALVNRLRPAHQRRGHGQAMMAEVARRLEAMGCPKLNLMVRHDNQQAVGFYARLGYDEAAGVVLGKRLIEDPRGS